MSRKFRDENGPDQAMLLPADPRQWLPDGHLAWRVLDLAAGMDLSRFGAPYLVAGDGTKLKANASMAANVTAAKLDAQITELEAVIDAEFLQWAQDMLDGDSDGAAPARPRDSGGTDEAAPGKTKKPKKPKNPGLVLERRKAARTQIQARQDARGQQEQGKLQARITELAARVEKKEAAVRKWEKEASDRLERRARTPPAGQPARGTRPLTAIHPHRGVH